MNNLVREARFSPAVKKYFLWLPVFGMFISIIGIPLAIVWLLGPGQYFARRYFDSLHCELTESKLKFTKGVLVRVDKTIPLENIQDLTFIEGPILKMFGLSILKIETAGHGGSHTADMRLIGIEGASEFRNVVLEQRDRNKSLALSPNHSGQSEEMLQVLKEIRDVLKDIRGEQNT
ncbi:MAG: PH domain-containing protein [Flavobacteriales bacterium]|nr:PH domain-containing protein [Flavobacteriales bacterium]